MLNGVYIMNIYSLNTWEVDKVPTEIRIEQIYVLLIKHYIHLALYEPLTRHYRYDGHLYRYTRRGYRYDHRCYIYGCPLGHVTFSSQSECSKMYNKL